MKKFRSFVVLLLSLMVFITSSGMAVNLHYCAGDLQNVSLNQTDTDCGMESQIVKEFCDVHPNQISLKNADSCCKDTHIVAKTNTTVSPTKAKDQSAFVQTFTFINHYFTSLFDFNHDSDDENQKEKESEISLFPLLKQGLYILLQQFRN